MNTPAHMALAWAVLGRKSHPPGSVWYILGGAFLPDMALFARAALGERDGLPILVDALNSLPVYAVLLGVALWLGKRGVALLAAAALLHIAMDLPLHADDARAHFWPLTDWRFQSPVSFWDGDHHGRIFGILEAVLFMGCGMLIWQRQEHFAAKALLVAFGALYAVTFVHFVGHAFANEHWAPW
ncbi:cobalamin biosynthesis protein CobQ [Actibacterium pelagium]|uniref:Cobalamin biosynthesis protein CobQ n=1 Tax=Actibacterium pelagium TaxID=2029103 RepID=A0A917AGE3_9RHOB|nr:cobalamin biosynthesis protein CobQ [Actibacterium pelagium]GGE49042.1 hypothetical protein GCM10011517_16130 [Actibacterium pelagium]